MKKVLSVVACGLLAACACDENQWEEVDVVTIDETVYAEPAPVVEMEPIAVAAPVVVKQEPVYIPAPTPVYDCPCAEVQPMPCYQMPCVQSCGCQPMPAPKPKVTTTKKIITTTTTLEEPCGKPVCEPVVTTHEEILPAEVSYQEYNQAPAAATQAQAEDLVEVTVERNPYRSDVVGMRSSSSKVDAAAAAKYKPEAYDVVATRATNRMLQDTSAIYDNGTTKTVYLKDTRLLSSDLPYGSHRLRGLTKEIIDGSRTYDVVNNANAADFVLETSADWYVAPNNPMPALQYKLTMLDKNGQKVNEWVEIIRQVQD
ncbi:MAG: hypothetical protein NC218_04970 [Acetobacter sp.]|nr:hypothetical protein [Acetobacter sp.]